MSEPAVLDDDTVARLRERLLALDYTAESVASRLGRVAQAALSRGETTPSVRATRAGTELDHAIRLLLLGTEVGPEELERSLPGLVEPLLAAGFLVRMGRSARARLELHPHVDGGGGGRHQWLVADRTPFRDGSTRGPGADHVLGVTPAATSLSDLTIRRPQGRALDLGTGCGIAALALTGHCADVVATDVNPRALALARLNARLNEVEVDVREGSLFAPVADEEFDLIVSNPPFVISPPDSDASLTYRDSGLAGDEMVRQVVVGAAQHLAPGGVAQVLANWLHTRDEPWQERIGGWLAQTAGVDAWVVQREAVDPARYVELWLRDGGRIEAGDYLRRYDQWFAWFERHGVAGVGMGWVVLRRTDRPEPVVHLEEWPHPVEQPLGAEVAQRFDRLDVLATMDDAELLATAWRVRPDVREESLGAPGQQDPEVIVLRQQRGLRRARQVDTIQAALVGASDGELSAERILTAVASLLGSPINPADQVVTLRELVAEGFLTPAR